MSVLKDSATVDLFLFVGQVGVICKCPKFINRIALRDNLQVDILHLVIAVFHQYVCVTDLNVYTEIGIQQHANLLCNETMKIHQMYFLNACF